MHYSYGPHQQSNHLPIRALREGLEVTDLPGGDRQYSYVVETCYWGVDWAEWEGKAVVKQIER